MRIYLVIFIAALAVAGCATNAQESPDNNQILVKIAEVKNVEIATPVNVSGILAAKDEMKLSFKTGGLIKSIQVQEGQNVKKGTLLARLDLAEIKARLTQAESGYDKANRDLVRLKKLYADSVVSYEQLQNITTAVQVAESNLEIARFNFHHSSIYAPSDGRILKQLSEENELISPGMPLFIYGSYDGQWVIKVGTSDKDIIRFHINDRANVQFDAYRNTVFEGHITELAAAANPMNGLFEIEVVINDQGKRLMSGFIGKVTLFPSEKKEIALIPASSLIEAQNMTGQVYVPERDNQTVKKVNVRIEQVLDEHLAIAKGLEDYPYVITDGAAYLQENSQIKIIE